MRDCTVLELLDQGEPFFGVHGAIQHQEMDVAVQLQKSSEVDECGLESGKYQNLGGGQLWTLRVNHIKLSQKIPKFEGVTRGLKFSLTTPSLTVIFLWTSIWIVSCWDTPFLDGCTIFSNGWVSPEQTLYCFWGRYPSRPSSCRETPNEPNVLECRIIGSSNPE